MLRWTWKFQNHLLFPHKNAAYENRKDLPNDDIEDDESIQQNINMFEKDDMVLFDPDEFSDYEEDEDYDDSEDVIING